MDKLKTVIDDAEPLSGCEPCDALAGSVVVTIGTGDGVLIGAGTNAGYSDGAC